MRDGMGQKILWGMEGLARVLTQAGAKRVLLVCGRSFDRLEVGGVLRKLDVTLVRFSDFSPNPRYEEVRGGVERFCRENCDTILAVGGGSAIDVAKCVKLFCRMNPAANYLTQERTDTGVTLIALPTTAGTGSESTRHAVIYFQGKKQSVSHPSIVPSCAILEPSVLKNLPLYQKKCTMLDALCQGIESWWSVNATEESRGLSRAAAEGVTANWRNYLAGDHTAARNMLEAANFSGQAINITATTAPHAMSYKLTALYGLPHGHAAALCLPEVWEYMLDHTTACVDVRGAEYLRKTLAEIGQVISPAQFRSLLNELNMDYPVSRDRGAELDLLTASVNPERLNNNPVPLGGETLRELYERIVKADEG